ncbi:MAG: sugar phosphate isomerase/epimerase [Lachnospiraceae bacterium]|nr:sugar phosphate isomerase/epimerase [Lachnospiraceae bacterium]
MMDSLFEITKAADTFNVDYAIEPVAWHPLSDAEITKEVIEKLNSDHVRVIFDFANVLPRPDETVQENYWRRCFDLLGDRIEAIHLKDFIINEDGMYTPRSLSEGCMDYSVLKEYLVGHPDMPVIREEIDPLNAAEDIRFMRKYFDGS